jgi:hypothetical protein
VVGGLLNCTMVTMGLRGEAGPPPPSGAPPLVVGGLLNCTMVTMGLRGEAPTIPNLSIVILAGTEVI